MHQELEYLAAVLTVYLASSWMTMRVLSGNRRDIVVALLNIAAVYGVFFVNRQRPFDFSGTFGFYLVIVSIWFGIMRSSASLGPWASRFAILCPVLFLAFFRLVPNQAILAAGEALGASLPKLPVLFGLSYMAFRCTRLVVEVRSGAVPMPTIWQYLAFSFFLPTLSVGPINSYSNFRSGFDGPPIESSVGRACLRILVGFVKFQFLCVLCSQLDYTSFLRNGHLHGWDHLLIAMVAYYLYLYWNFSGFCDMAIGASSLIGIRVAENFDNPLAARNIKDFWNRWHITLSEFMRDLVFGPVSRSLVGAFGIKHANHAIAVSIVVVFVLVGVWHGTGWNFLIFGLVHAIGLVANHYYTLGLKKWLGRERFRQYNQSRVIHAVAVLLTFAYCAASLFFFANSPAEIRAIFSVIAFP
jgi:D-alanyl-lipoteichoic acid acyltransferase DltB (MBOAT superfamily)